MISYLMLSGEGGGFEGFCNTMIQDVCPHYHQDVNNYLSFSLTFVGKSAVSGAEI